MSTEPSPREVDISFSSPMISAISDGRKSVTRRIIKFPKGFSPDTLLYVSTVDDAFCFEEAQTKRFVQILPRYRVGDVLRVREAAWMWCEKVPDGLTKTKRPKFRYVPELSSAYKTFYAADGDGIHKPVDRFLSFVPAQRFGYRLKIPRFLPGWAVRRRLRVTSVRVERLNDITEEDAIREGVNAIRCNSCGYTKHDADTLMDHGLCGEPYPESSIPIFRVAWERINGPGSWDANPWVARIEFERL